MASQTLRENLWIQWLNLWQLLYSAGGAERAQRVFDDLVVRYSEPYRAYHTLDHIADCLRKLRELPFQLNHTDRRAAEFALWYHDAVYDPRRDDNEERSAQLAKTMLSVAQDSSRFGEWVAQCVADLVLMTKNHTAPLDDAIGCLIVDIDLSILGAAPMRFGAYENQIRKEYEWVPWDEFASKRAAVLRSFLERDHIFATQIFRDRYEKQARRNLAESIEELEEEA